MLQPPAARPGLSLNAQRVSNRRPKVTAAIAVPFMGERPACHVTPVRQAIRPAEAQWTARGWARDRGDRGARGERYCTQEASADDDNDEEVAGWDDKEAKSPPQVEKVLPCLRPWAARRRCRVVCGASLRSEGTQATGRTNATAAEKETSGIRIDRRRTVC
jgi:hypothetical protein